MIRSVISLPLLGLSLMAVPAMAVDVNIAEFIGEVTVVEGQAKIDVLREGKHAFDFGEEGGELFAYSNKDWRDVKDICNGKASLKDYPKLRISVPKGSNLFVDQSYIDLDVKTDLKRADLQLGGCFETRLQDVEALFLDKSGTGGVEVGDTQKLDISKSGRGSIKVASADTVYIDKSGTDDIRVGPVKGSITIDRSGTGLIDFKSVSGDVRIEQSGSGDVVIHDGRVGELDIDMSGSGDVRIDAPVEEASVSLSGSSKVDLKSVSGNLRQSTSGSAKVYVARR